MAGSVLLYVSDSDLYHDFKVRSKEEVRADDSARTFQEVLQTLACNGHQGMEALMVLPSANGYTGTPANGCPPVRKPC